MLRHVQVERVAGQRAEEALRRLYALYLHDLSRFTDHYRLDAAACWQPSYVDDFLSRRDCAAYLLREDDGAAVGFAWVGGGDFPRKRADRDWRLAEFFVAAPHRRRGLGRSAVPLVLAAHPGRWQLEVIEGNDAALGFWRDVLEGRDGLAEVPGEGELVFRFEVRGGR